MQAKVLKNAGWIIACKVVKAVLMFIVTAITARYLGTYNYGLINYAAGLVSFVVPIMRLGLDSVMVHEIINRPNEEGKVIGTIMGMASASSLLCIVGVVAFTMMVNVGETDTIIVCAIYSLMLFFQAFELIHYWFQAKFLAKFSALAMMISYIIVTIFQIVLVLIKVNVYFFAISYSLDYFLISLILVFVYKKQGGYALKFSFSLAKKLFSVSKYYIIANLMTSILSQIDIVMIKLMISTEAAGIYATAHTCETMLSFVFYAIIDSFRPEIFSGRNESIETFEKRMIELFSIVIYFSLFTSTMITLFSPLIIKIMYGNEFVAAVDILRVAVWFANFSFLGTVRNIWILAEGKQKYILVINTFGAVCNVLLNYFMINSLGIMGAALASVVTNILMNVVLVFIIKPIRRSGTLMLKGLNFKNLTGIFDFIKKKSEKKNG